MPNLIGASALTLVPRTNGVTDYVYAGRPVPGDADPDRLAQLLEGGFIVDADAPAGGIQNDDPASLEVSVDAPTAAKARQLAKAHAKDGGPPEAGAAE